MRYYKIFASIVSTGEGGGVNTITTKYLNIWLAHTFACRASR